MLGQPKGAHLPQTATTSASQGHVLKTHVFLKVMRRITAFLRQSLSLRTPLFTGSFFQKTRVFTLFEFRHRGSGHPPVLRAKGPSDKENPRPQPLPGITTHNNIVFREKKTQNPKIWPCLFSYETAYFPLKGEPWPPLPTRPRAFKHLLHTPL